MNSGYVGQVREGSNSRTDVFGLLNQTRHSGAAVGGNQDVVWENLV